jgi:tRNA(Ile2) C34 agmatinyltransferase TiaS
MSIPLLATEEGVELFCGLLALMGAMCPKCGHGTRVTSKRWAKCKKCGERVERRALPATAAKP